MTHPFTGFLVQTDPSVGIPRAFFTDVLPQITEMAELQVALAIFRLASEAGGIESPVSEDALHADRTLRSALRTLGSPREPGERIGAGLDLATGRGTLLRFVAAQGQDEDVWYYVNTPVNQALVAAMARGSVAPPRVIWRDSHPPEVVPERPNVFRLYEQNVGPLTPLIADHLVRALETWPVEWIEDAVTEAVTYNKRSWRYIQRILEGWQTQGREPRERYG